jgi:predicted porin
MLMKRSLLIAALSTVAAGSALAQSSVTVYGRLNETVERQKVGDTSTTVLNDNASRLGFKGTEDLGGGLKANFLIEHRFQPDTGASTGGAAGFWSGDSWVGLSSNLGDLRLGRMTSGAYFATADYVSYHNHDTGTSADALYSLGFQNWVTNNKISYTTPSLAGATVELQYSLREGTPPPGDHNSTDLAVNYGIGNLALGAGFTKLGENKQFAFRGQYTFGDFTLGGYVQRTAFKDSFVDGGKATIVRLAGMYALGASEFHANVGVAGKIDGDADTDAKQFTLGYNYNLSKRTKVYTYYTKVDNKAASAYQSGTAGADFSSLALGVRHNF